MARKPRPSIELASAIGSAAADLHDAYGDEIAVRDLAFLWKVNPDLFAWLLNALDRARARHQARTL